MATDPLPWEPTLNNPLKGVVIWPVPENKDVSVTLFKDPRTAEYEDKEWTFIIEDVSHLLSYDLHKECLEKRNCEIESFIDDLCC